MSPVNPPPPLSLMAKPQTVPVRPTVGLILKSLQNSPLLSSADDLSFLGSPQSSTLTPGFLLEGDWAWHPAPALSCFVWGRVPVSGATISGARPLPLITDSPVSQHRESIPQLHSLTTCSPSTCWQPCWIQAQSACFVAARLIKSRSPMAKLCHTLSTKKKNPKQLMPACYHSTLSLFGDTQSHFQLKSQMISAAIFPEAPHYAPTQHRTISLTYKIEMNVFYLNHFTVVSPD